MCFLLKGKKEDLLELATELGLEATVDMTKPILKNLITKSAGYDEEDTKLMYEGIVEERKERELLEERKRRDNLELEKLRIEAQIGLSQEILSRNNRTPTITRSKMESVYNELMAEIESNRRTTMENLFKKYENAKEDDDIVDFETMTIISKKKGRRKITEQTLGRAYKITKKNETGYSTTSKGRALMEKIACHIRSGGRLNEGCMPY
ncbi:hypothetical protein TNIN_275652 [Trichonephila inaurata madagascariensis]|uniref:Uncharacterized protein n=1 Tax=Trichonephila inaurata madagascariensis TaxID=2747483 RepID=A0A8X6XWF4_9ARAC|nr:hypothetical protein TNIN_275652 [Trichonephila inaurata madagascariensis]